MDFNWNKCIICQQDKPEPLKCPLDSLEAGSEAFYSSFLANVEEFRKIDALPTKVHFGDGISVGDLTSYHASWHKSCHLKYSISKLTRATKRKSNVEDSGRTSGKRQAMDIKICMFCEKGLEEGDLHQILTFDADANIREMLTELQDTQLLAKIGTEDLIAKEVKYHLKCLIKLRNRYRSYKRQNQVHEQEVIDERINESRVFVELTTYIEKSVEAGTLLFKVAELYSLYINRLGDFGIRKTVNKTRFKNDLLQHFSEAQEQCDGKNTVIVFTRGMQNMLKEALKKRDYSEDALILAKAATIIRNDTFRHECFKFDGNFPSKCQENSIPSSLKSLISLIYNGPNLKDQDKEESHACISVRQLIVFNMKKSTSTAGTKERHTLDREPPLPIYIGLNIHQQTRCKKLIMQLYCMGISISYDRVLDLEDRIAASVCEQCDEDGVVSPICLKKQLFTVGAIDNLDYNPSSTTSQSSFHGTGISLIQFPTKDNPGIDRPLKSLPQSTDRKYNLPGSYEIVPAVALRPNDVTVPILNCNTEQRQSHFDEAFAKQKSWVSHALHLLENEDLHNDDKIVWGAYHALQQQPSLEDPLGVCALLPLFYEKAATPSMVKHGVGKNYRFLSVNAISHTLGEPKSRALPVFHALSGCDTTSAFRGKGKKSAWQAWQAFEEVTATFEHLSLHPFEDLNADSSHFATIERFIVVLYDRTSPLSLVNDEREELFCKRSRSVERLPPTKDALLQHTRRSVCQAGIWTTSTQTLQVLPSPEDFAWNNSSGTWLPVWITIPEVSKACRELVKCCCKGDCLNCTCAKSNLACSPLCSCKCTCI